jgi:uncharacterized protein YjdB
MKISIPLYIAGLGLCLSGCVSPTLQLTSEKPMSVDNQSTATSNPQSGSQTETPELNRPHSNDPSSPLPANDSLARTPTSSLLPQVQSVSLMVSKRYLDNKGESVQLTPVLKDTNGQILNAENYTLKWNSSRPADLIVDDNGMVTALVEYGYAEISLRISGIEAKQLISVTTLVGSSSSGGNTVLGTESIDGQIEFQF